MREDAKRETSIEKLPELGTLVGVPVLWWRGSPEKPLDLRKCALVGGQSCSVGTLGTMVRAPFWAPDSWSVLSEGLEALSFVSPLSARWGVWDAETRTEQRVPKKRCVAGSIPAGPLSLDEFAFTGFGVILRGQRRQGPAPGFALRCQNLAPDLKTQRRWFGGNRARIS